MLSRITFVEAKLFFREPGVWLLTILLPTIVLVVVGLMFGVEPDPALGGQRWIDTFAPSMVVMTLAILGVNTLPARLVKYREKGVMRRLSTTPASPGSVLIAQLAVNMGVAIVSLVVLIGVGNIVLETDYPHADSTWPESRQRAARALAGMAQSEVDAICWRNAADLFGLDPDPEPAG